MMFLVTVVVTAAVAQLLGWWSAILMTPGGIVSQVTPAVQVQPKSVDVDEGSIVSFSFTRRRVHGRVKEIAGRTATILTIVNGHTQVVRRKVHQLTM